MRIVHISLYPPKGEKHISSSGVASYAKNLVTAIATETPVEQFVLSEKLSENTEQDEEDGITVIRCFNRDLRFVWQLHKQLRLLKPDAIHIQQELALYGGIMTAFALQFLVAMHKNKTATTLHGVLSLQQVTADFVRQNNYSAPAWLVRLALQAIYRPLVFWSKRVIVHEPYFKQILIDEYAALAEKITVIPHGVEDFRPQSKKLARDTLDLGQKANIALFMGYASGYKGIDLLIEGFAEYCKTDKNAFLVIGSGPNPKLKNDAEYQKIYQGYQQKAAQLIPSNQYRWVGFINEHDITTYYSAADVSLYPYTTALSSSGPMSISIGHQKPFLASDSFAGVFNRRVLFKKTPKHLAAKLHEFFLAPTVLEHYYRQLKSERVWLKVGATTLEVYRSMINNEQKVAEIG